MIGKEKIEKNLHLARNDRYKWQKRGLNNQIFTRWFNLNFHSVMVKNTKKISFLSWYAQIRHTLAIILQRKRYYSKEMSVWH